MVEHTSKQIMIKLPSQSATDTLYKIYCPCHDIDKVMIINLCILPLSISFRKCSTDILSLVSLGKAMQKTAQLQFQVVCIFCLLNWFFNLDLFHQNTMGKIESLQKVAKFMVCAAGRWHLDLVSYPGSKIRSFVVCVPFGVWQLNAITVIPSRKYLGGKHIKSMPLYYCPPQL